MSGRLPAAAMEHRAWWANSESNSHARHGWMNVGYETSSVDMQGRELIFLRAPDQVRNRKISAELASPVVRSAPLRTRGRGQLEDVVRAAGGAENLARIVRAIQQYIDGDLLETELGRILRKVWPRR